jgi:hypothetical protein
VAAGTTVARAHNDEVARWQVVESVKLRGRPEATRIAVA